jgi:hypothetical protein
MTLDPGGLSAFASLTHLGRRRARYSPILTSDQQDPKIFTDSMATNTSYPLIDPDSNHAGELRYRRLRAQTITIQEQYEAIAESSYSL